jgi:uncharacterized protein (DUF2236 family)
MPVSDLRNTIQRQVHAMVGFGTGVVDLDHPAGDRGLFGPGSMAWKVHADFTSMLVGGVSALLLQMLHPAALAGVWDHSDFRSDMTGRLKRTAQFVSGTTFAAASEAERLIARVQAVHEKVKGTLPDGTAYSACDGALLTFVHVAEMRSFLAAYMRYVDPQLPGHDQDRYFAEVALVADRLGASGVPRSRAAVDAYLEAMRPQLVFDDRTREIARALIAAPTPSILIAPFRRVVMDGGLLLLPSWARAMHEFRPRPGSAIGVNAMRRVMRWSLRDSSAKRAARRVEAA